jgi:hypothetical protein
MSLLQARNPSFNDATFPDSSLAGELTFLETGWSFIWSGGCAIYCYIIEA